MHPHPNTKPSAVSPACYKAHPTRVVGSATSTCPAWRLHRTPSRRTHCAPRVDEAVQATNSLTPPSKRAQELIGVEQQQAALQLLHEHVTSKRTRNSPIASLEPVMILFVELCVDLRKGKLAKDGLYQYKNTAQNTNVGTIEVGQIKGNMATPRANTL